MRVDLERVNKIAVSELVYGRPKVSPTLDPLPTPARKDTAIAFNPKGLRKYTFGQPKADKNRRMPHSATTTYQLHFLPIGLGLDRGRDFTLTVFGPGLPTRTGRHFILPIAKHLLSRLVRPCLIRRMLPSGGVNRNGASISRNKGDVPSYTNWPLGSRWNYLPSLPGQRFVPRLITDVDAVTVTSPLLFSSFLPVITRTYQ